jgi:hypothetical protein
MNKLVVYLAVLAIAFCLKSNAQTVIYSNKVEKDILQIELYSDQTVSRNNLSKTVNWSLPSALLRYGLSDRVELQVVTPFTLEQIHMDNTIYSKHYMNKVQIGAIINIVKRNKWIPETSFTYRSIVPFESDETVEKISHLVSLNLSNRLSEKLLLNYNFRYKINPQTTNSEQFVANLGYAVNKKFQVFAETSIHIISSTVQSNLFVGGLAYTLMKDLFLNLYYGNCLKQQTKLIGGIVTWRFNTKSLVLKNKLF